MEKSDWWLIKNFLYVRTVIPNRSAAFWLYFIVVVLIIGILGSLISALPSYVESRDVWKSTSLSLVGYAIVLLCSSSIDLIFVNLEKDEMKYTRIHNAIKMIGISFLILSILIGFIVYFLPNERLSFFSAVIFCLLSMYFWWITSYTNLKSLVHTPIPNVEEITGGNPNKHVLKGSMKGYKS